MRHGVLLLAHLCFLDLVDTLLMFLLSYFRRGRKSRLRASRLSRHTSRDITQRYVTQVSHDGHVCHAPRVAWSFYLMYESHTLAIFWMDLSARCSDVYSGCSWSVCFTSSFIRST